MIIRLIRRHRAQRNLEIAKARVASLSQQIDHRRKSKQAWRPLLGSLADARRDMLRAEIELRGQ